MKWRKLGKIWQPEGNLAWAKTHAAIPTPMLMPSGDLRIYLSCRDQNNIGRVGYVDLDPDNPLRVMRISKNPVLTNGEPGHFDDNGVGVTSVFINHDGNIGMYYFGFELCHHIRYRLLAGLAISNDGGANFSRVNSMPILERSETEAFVRSGVWVLPPDQDNSHYRMWYVAGNSWEVIEGKPMPVYDIRYAESRNGIDWPQAGRVVLSLDLKREYGFGRPYVINKNGSYKMFYSIRNRVPNAYGLGYAESNDGINWQRKDHEMGITTSDQGWDSESVEYSAVIDVNGKTYCFYNGNDFGGSGFGVAEMVE